MEIKRCYVIWALAFFIFWLSSITASLGVSPTCVGEQYLIMYEASGIRDDGAKCYFVWVKPPDLKNDSFKNDIKEDVKEIAGEKGGKITIYFFDDRKILEVVYHGILNRVPKSLSKKEVRHHLATFSGQYQVGSFYNYLYFFPALTPANMDPVLLNYVEWEVFDPFQADDTPAPRKII